VSLSNLVTIFFLKFCVGNSAFTYGRPRSRPGHFNGTSKKNYRYKSLDLNATLLLDLHYTIPRTPIMAARRVKFSVHMLPTLALNNFQLMRLKVWDYRGIPELKFVKLGYSGGRHNNRIGWQNKTRKWITPRTWVNLTALHGRMTRSKTSLQSWHYTVKFERRRQLLRMVHSLLLKDVLTG